MEISFDIKHYVGAYRRFDVNTDNVKKNYAVNPVRNVIHCIQLDCIVADKM